MLLSLVLFTVSFLFPNSLLALRSSEKNIQCQCKIDLFSISKFVAGARYSYDYESHVQLKQEAFVKAAQSRSRHLSFKTNAKLAVTYLWHHNGNNETILQLQVNIFFLSIRFVRQKETYILNYL